MLAVLLALISAISFSGSDFTAGLAARRAGVIRVTVTAEATKAILITSVVPFVSTQSPSLLSLAWGTAAGVSGVGGTMALYLGFRRGAFSVASSVSALGAAVVSVAAGMLLGERPGGLVMIGIIVALPAILGVSISARQADMGSPGGSNPAALAGPAARDAGPGQAVPSGGRGYLAAGCISGVAAGACFGLSLVGLNRAGSVTDLWPLAVAELAALMTVACIAAVTGQLAPPPAGTRRLSVLAGIIAAAGIFSYFLATHKGLLTVTGVIYSLYPAGTILLARLLLRERLTAVRIIGLILTAVSVGLIAASKVG